MKKYERFNLGVTILSMSLFLATAACSKHELPPLAIKNVTVIDGTGVPPKTNMTILLVKNRIAQIASADEAALPAGTIEVDGGGKYLIPGLWDMHVHALYPSVTEHVFKMFLVNGVTGIRDMNGPMPLKDILKLRERVLSGKIPGPRFVAPGPLVDGPGRGSHARGPQTRVAETERAAREIVRELKS